jgi:polyphosphate kinase
LSRRVEVLVPIKDPRIRHFLKETVLTAYLKDNVNARELRADGSYVRVKPLEGEKRFDCQREFEGRDLSAFTKPGKREASAS